MQARVVEWVKTWAEISHNESCEGSNPSVCTFFTLHSGLRCLFRVTFFFLFYTRHSTMEIEAAAVVKRTRSQKFHARVAYRDANNIRGRKRERCRRSFRPRRRSMTYTPVDQISTATQTPTTDVFHPSSFWHCRSPAMTIVDDTRHEDPALLALQQAAEMYLSNNFEA